MKIDEKLIEGFAVFAQLGNDELNPVSPVDFEAQLRADEQDCGDEDYAREERDFIQKIKIAYDGCGERAIAEYDDAYIGKRVRFTVFKSWKDARDMMNACELGFTGYGQGRCLCKVVDSYFSVGERGRQDQRIRGDLEFNEFAVYPVMLENGKWKLLSKHPVETYSRSYGERYTYGEHPAVQLAKKLAPDEDINVPEYTETGKFLSPSEFVAELKKCRSRKTVVYGIGGDRRLLVPRLAERGQNVDKFILAADPAEDYSVQNNVDSVSKSQSRYFVLLYKGGSYGIESVQKAPSGDITVVLGKYEDLFESAAREQDQQIQFWAHMLDDARCL